MDSFKYAEKTYVPELHAQLRLSLQDNMSATQADPIRRYPRREISGSRSAPLSLHHRHSKRSDSRTPGSAQKNKHNPSNFWGYTDISLHRLSWSFNLIAGREVLKLAAPTDVYPAPPRSGHSRWTHVLTRVSACHSRSRSTALTVQSDSPNTLNLPG